MKEGEDGVYLIENLPLEAELLPETLRERLLEGYTPVLRLALWYSRAFGPRSQRGLVLAATRMITKDGSKMHVLTATHNGAMFVHELTRKNDAAGAQVAEKIREMIPEIRTFALSSAAPAWSVLRERIRARLAA